MATDNGAHVVSLPTMLGNSFEVYRRLQGTNGVKGEKGVENSSLYFNLFSLMSTPCGRTEIFDFEEGCHYERYN